MANLTTQELLIKNMKEALDLTQSFEAAENQEITGDTPEFNNTARTHLLASGQSVLGSLEGIPHHTLENVLKHLNNKQVINTEEQLKRNHIINELTTR